MHFTEAPSSVLSSLNFVARGAESLVKWMQCEATVIGREFDTSLANRIDQG